MNNYNSQNILEQIGNDPFVKVAWKLRVAWFLFKLFAVVGTFLYIMIDNHW